MLVGSISLLTVNFSYLEGSQYLQTAQDIIVVSVVGEAVTLPQGCTIISLDFVSPFCFISVLLYNNNCLNLLPFGTQGRSLRLNESYCLYQRNE